MVSLSGVGASHREKHAAQEESMYRANKGFMNSHRSSLALGFIVGILLATTGFALLVRQNNRRTSEGQDIITLKLGHSLDQSHPVHAAMEFMAERLQEKSHGTVTLQIFPNSQLGSETEMIEQVQRGALALTKSSTAAIESFIPAMAVFGVPYVFRDEEHFWKFAAGPVGTDLLVAGTQVGIRGLCYWDAGARSFYTVNRPILEPADLQGLKIRVQSSKTALELVENLGGSPTPIPFGELYTALQQSLVDGAENNPPSFYSNRHFEVCKHLSLDEHTRVPDMLLFSEKVWNELSPEVRAWVQEAADESVDFQRRLWAKQSEEVLSAVEEKGVTVHRPAKAKFIEAVSKMRRSYAGTEIGELLDKIEAY